MPLFSTALPGSATARGILFMLAAVLMFSLMDATVKYLLQSQDVMQILWARYTGQTAVVAVFLAPRLLSLLKTRRPGGHLLRSLLQFATTALFFSGLAYIALAEAAAIMNIYPVLITLGAALFLGERLGPRRLAGVAVALVGALIVIRPGSGVFSPAALLPVGAAICYAAFALMTRSIGRQENIWTSLLYTALVGTVITSVAMPFLWQPVAGWNWLGLIAVGVIGALGQLFLIRSLMLAEAGVLAPFGYAGLLFSVLWGMVFFAEFPDAWTWTGALVIVGAGLYVWYRETRTIPRTPDGAHGPDRT